MQSDFSDLRSVEDRVLNLAKLSVEPFEEGSFVIPGQLPETELLIGNQRFNSKQVLRRFVEVMTNVSDPQFPTSIGSVQAIEELGKITRREAEQIEYFPSVSSDRLETVRINNDFIESVTRSRIARRNPRTVLDSLVGVITAVDLVRTTLTVWTDDRTTVRGRFEAMIEEPISRALTKRVRLHGIVEYVNNAPQFIRAYTMEFLDEE